MAVRTPSTHHGLDHPPAQPCTAVTPPPSATASPLVPHMHCLPSRRALIDLSLHSAAMPTACCRGPLCATYTPLLVATQRRRRGVVLPSAAVYCRHLNNNVITAIPGGLFNFTTALIGLYGRPRPTMGSAAHLHRHSGRPATLGSRIALSPPYALLSLPACSDRLVSALCRDANRVLPRTPVYDLYLPPRHHPTPPPWRDFAIRRGILTAGT